ncbi:hypothetical protein [Planococcus lenghuensis]|uniref:Uncharacterized protein n=1 Tax=Planococcus lenghuensis TaxID=2213202 RepID=A0A1Q2L127_9BACL|nr:hypothetical protein [Planococcus lenghuensis]AQQ54160.1 hypothetical protein B0X71_14300 [Planococcus lenghuensis]
MEVKKVEVILAGDDYEQPNPFRDLIRISEIYCYDKQGKAVQYYGEFKKHSRLFKFNYNSVKEVVHDVAVRFNVKPEMIDVG